MRVHRAKFNGATGNGRTSVTPLTVNNCQQLSDRKNYRMENRSGSNRVVNRIVTKL
jgi:hypothetical protein